MHLELNSTFAFSYESPLSGITVVLGPACESRLWSSTM